MAEDNAFEDLVSKCIEAYGITFSDTVALNANGVIGKLRVLVLENSRYQRETRMLKARHTIEDLKEVNELISGIDAPDEIITPPPEPPEPPEEVVPDDENYDIRNKNSKKNIIPKDKKPGRPKKPQAAVTTRKGFDKSKIDTRLKLIQERRDILDSSNDEEEKETEALNIFFIALTKEEFEAIETVEVSEGSSSSSGFEDAPNAAKETALGSSILKETKRTSTSFHYEGEGDERTLVED